MSTRQRVTHVGVLALVSLVVGLVVWILVEFLVPDSARIELDPRDRAPSATATFAPSPAPSSDAATSRELESTAEVLVDTRPGEPVGEIDRDLCLHGRVLDSRRAPIAGATVEVFLPEAREFSVLDLDYHGAIERLTRRNTDVDGRFAFVLERGRPVDLKVSAGRSATSWVPNCYAGERVEVVLDQGCTLTGRITRSADGTPVAGAKLRVFRLGGPSNVSFHETTNARGEYRFQGLPADRMELEVLPMREQAPPWIDLEFGADGTLVKDFSLEPGLVVRGQVTDATTGKPIERAEIGEGWTFRRSVWTDAAGRYELSGFGSPGVSDVHVRADGYGKQGRQNFPPPIDGSLAVDFALAPARRAVGRILDAKGASVHGAYVAAVASGDTEEGQLTDWPSTRCGADGRFELRNLNPRLRHVLFVREPGLATVVYDFPVAESVEEVLDLGDVVLPEAATLLGRVVDERGEGVPGVEVVLSGWNHDRFRWASDERLGGHYVGRRRGRSDDLGRFSFADLPAGSFQLKSRASGRTSSVDVAVEIAEGETHGAVDVLMPAGETIEGTVVNERGEGIPGIWISVHGTDGTAGSDATTRSKEEGRFQIRGLLPGKYRLQVHHFGSDESDPRDLYLPVELKDVEAGSRDLRIEMSTGSSIRGVLLDAVGAPVARTFVQARIPGIVAAWGASTDRDGRFTLVVPANAVVELIAPGHERPPGAEVLATGIAAGSTDVILRLPSPR